MRTLGLRSPLVLGLAWLVATACGDSGDDDDDGADDTTTGTSVTGATMTTTMTTSMTTTETTGVTTTMTTTDPTTEGTTAGDESSSAGDESSSTGEPSDTVTLQNDGFEPADSLFWQTWPSAGDCWASTYEIDPGLYPFDIVGVQVAIGGAPETASFELGIWEVDADGMPSTAIDTAMVDIEGDMQGPDLDVQMLLDVPTIDSGSFAVVMCHVDHMGAPSIGTDLDGTVDAAHNFVFQQIMDEWVPAPDFFGIDGDFIMRAIVRPL